MALVILHIIVNFFWVIVLLAAVNKCLPIMQCIVSKMIIKLITMLQVKNNVLKWVSYCNNVTTNLSQATWAKIQYPVWLLIKVIVLTHLAGPLKPIKRWFLVLEITFNFVITNINGLTTYFFLIL